MRDSGALTELLLTRCTEKLRFPPQEAYGEATGITPWSARSIIWPMYARPIRISRGVIPAVRSCSCPDGWLREINGSGQRSEAAPIDHRSNSREASRMESAHCWQSAAWTGTGIANAAGHIGKHGATRPD